MVLEQADRRHGQVCYWIGAIQITVVIFICVLYIPVTDDDCVDDRVMIERAES